MPKDNDKDNLIPVAVKRKLSIALTIAIFIFYYIATDPDTELFQNLSYGATLILTLNIFVIAMTSILLIEFAPDYFIDVIYGKESDARKIATKTPEGAGAMLIAKSIRMLAYGIIVAASIISYNVG